MVLTGLDLGAWLTKSGAVVVVYEYDEVTQVFLGFVVHPMREVRYGKDGRLVSCCFLPGESQTVEHEQNLHKWLHLDRKLGDADAIITVNQVEWEKSYAGEAALAPPRQYNFETQEWDPVPTMPDCRGCGKPLLAENAWMEDGCPCNFPKGGNAARWQDSAGAGIYDEMPPLVNTYADRTLNASRLLRDAVNDAKSVFDTPASIGVVSPPLREWRVLTPGGYWESIQADVVTTRNTSVDMYRDGQQVGFFVSPQAVIAGHEVE